jgi:hypothetical protein
MMNQSHPAGTHSSQPHPAVYNPPLQDINLDPIGLVDDEPRAALETVKKIKAFGPTDTAKSHDWKRKANINGAGAVRMRSFHGRLSDEGLIFMDDKINEWLDAHPEVEVKFVTSTVGTYEGKIREPALILNLWY